jgi:hypothetical protein
LQSRGMELRGSPDTVVVLFEVFTLQVQVIFQSDSLRYRDDVHITMLILQHEYHANVFCVFFDVI